MAIQKSSQTDQKPTSANARPKLRLFRSNKQIYAQLVKGGGQIITGATVNRQSSKSKIETAFAVGQKIGQAALKLGLKSVVFNRGGYRFHGRVKALADGARKVGLKF